MHVREPPAVRIGALHVVLERDPRAEEHLALFYPDNAAERDELYQLGIKDPSRKLGIEDMVRANPGQWLWIHNRWPTKRDEDLMRGRT